MGGSFAPRDGEALTSVSAIFLPVLVAGGVTVRAAFGDAITGRGPLVKV